MVCIRSDGQAGFAFFGTRRETTGWPKDKHSLSTARKVFFLQMWGAWFNPRRNEQAVDFEELKNR